MKLLSISILLSLIYTQAICQGDSLEIMKNYFRMSDSLCEIGQYEKAREYFYTGSFYRPIIGETNDSRKEYLMEYSERKRKVDVGITYYLTDSIRYIYRVEKGYEWLSLSKNQHTLKQVEYCIFNAAQYFQDAIKYSNGNIGATDELNNIVNALPTDTIVIEPWGTAGLQLIYKRYWPRSDEFIPYNGNFRLYHDAGDTLYLSKDTSIFSGVLTSFSPAIPDFRDIAIYKTWEFKSGIAVRQTFHYLCPSKIQESLDTTVSTEEQKILKSQNIEGYYCGYSKDWGNREVWFSINGDTLSKKEIFDSGYFEVKFHANGDTSEFLLSKQIDEFSMCDKFSRWNIEGNRIEYLEHKYSTPEATEQWSKNFALDENCDTLKLETWTNGLANGVFIHSLFNDADSLYIIKLLWKENLLEDYVNNDILFFDMKGNIIDENTFLNSINCDYSQSPENLIVQLNDPVTINGQNYSLIAYPEPYVLRYTNFEAKIWKRISKSIEKLKND